MKLAVTSATLGNSPCIQLAFYDGEGQIRAHPGLIDKMPAEPVSHHNGNTLGTEACIARRPAGHHPRRANEVRIVLTQAYGRTVDGRRREEDRTLTGSLLRREETDTGDPTVSARDASKGESIVRFRLLVVDDDADTREMMALILESYGASVRTASSAAEAFAAVLEDRPAVMLADIGMPREDGYSLIRRIRVHEKAKGLDRLPAVAITAYAGKEHRTQAMNAGYDGHLAKPIDPIELVHAVARLVRSI